MGWLTIEKEQNTNHTQVSQTCISKTKLIFFYGRCRVVHCALFLRVQQRTVAPFLNPDLTNKSWVVHLNCTLMAYRNNSGTTSDRYVRILDLREGNEESSEETTGCKASVYAEFDDCTRVGKFVKLFDFRHFERFFRFDQSDRKTYKKAISDGVNVSVVLDCGFGNTSKEK